MPMNFGRDSSNLGLDCGWEKRLNYSNNIFQRIISISLNNFYFLFHTRY